MKFALIFIATAVVDFVWAAYIRAAAEKLALRAAIYSAIIYLLGASVALAYVAEHALVWPAVAGAFFGTLVGTKYAK